MDHEPQILGSLAAPAAKTLPRPSKNPARRPAARRAAASLALLALCLTAGGCGQKGALHLPEPGASAPASITTFSK